MIKHAIEQAKKTGKNYFVFEDRDEYGSGRHYDYTSESFYHESYMIPEAWVKAFVGPEGVIETY